METSQNSGGAAGYSISASIVTYHNFEEAQRAAASLLQHTQKRPLQLFLIDNASCDGTFEKMKMAFVGKAKLLQNPKNLGYGGGHNASLPLLTSKYHAVVNPDIEISGDVLAQLADYMDLHPEVAAVEPLLRFPDGEVQQIPRRRPTFLALFSRRVHLPFLRRAEAHYLMLDEDLTKPQSIGFLTGAFFLMRTEVFKAIGGFDPEYFMYFEDVDIGRRAEAYGKLMYLPQAEVTHRWNRRTATDRRHFFMQLRSMFTYFRKWGL